MEKIKVSYQHYQAVDTTWTVWVEVSKKGQVAKFPFIAGNKFVPFEKEQNNALDFLKIKGELRQDTKEVIGLMVESVSRSYPITH